MARTPRSGGSLPHLDSADWQDRLARLREDLPHLVDSEWRDRLRGDTQLLGRLLHDVLKVDMRPSNRPGPRPAVSEEEGAARLRQLLGEDYTDLPFTEAFSLLTGRENGTLRGIAARTGLSKSRVDRLRRGLEKPDSYELTVIAQAYGKDPSWFREWREMAVAALLVDTLSRQPEATTAMYRKLMSNNWRRSIVERNLR